MKKKVYFKYNPKTSSYERVYPNVKDRILTVLRHLLSGILIGGGGLLIFFYYVGSPGQQASNKDMELIRTQYELLSKRVDGALDVMKDIQQRDDNLYRAIFHADPISPSIRYSGVGGAGRYDYLMNISSPEMIIKTTKKVDLLHKQLYIQSYSFDEIINLAKNQKDRLAHIPSIQPVSDKHLRQMASGYGHRIDPIYGTVKFHSGMDFASNIGTPVYAPGNGTVIYADWKQGYGMCIMIDHGYGFQTLYAHLSKYNVRVGQKVIRGEKIAEVGNTGKSTGPHLHYEVHVKGQPDNPAKYYFMDLTPEEYDNMLKTASNHGQVMD